MVSKGWKHAAANADSISRESRIAEKSAITIQSAFSLMDEAPLEEVIVPTEPTKSRTDREVRARPSIPGEPLRRSLANGNKSS